MKKISKLSTRQSSIDIRQASDTDAELMFRLQHLDGDEIDKTNPELLNRFKDYVSTFDAQKIEVVERDGEIIGRLRIVRDDDIYIGGIQILPEYRGLGIGTNILEKLIDESKQEQVPVRLEVFHDNDDAFALYEKLGFEIIGENEKQKIMQYDPTNN